MNTNLYSLVAMIVAVFLTGMYLRGDRARKAEIREELDLIQQQQDLIMNTVASIRQQTQLKDSLLARQVDVASDFILGLDREGNLSTAQLEARGAEINALKTNLDSLMVSNQPAGGFRFNTPPLDSLSTTNSQEN